MGQYEDYKARKAKLQIREEMAQLHYGSCAAVGVPKPKLYVVIDKSNGKECFNGSRMTLDQFTSSTGVASRAYRLVPVST